MGAGLLKSRASWTDLELRCADESLNCALQDGLRGSGRPVLVRNHQEPSRFSRRMHEGANILLISCTSCAEHSLEERSAAAVVNAYKSQGTDGGIFRSHAARGKGLGKLWAHLKLLT